MSQARHTEVSKILSAEIAAGDYPVGGPFPTERELQKRFGVGRHTVREALKTLTAQGLLNRRRKLGARVLRKEPFGHYTHTMGDVGSLFHFADDTRLKVHHDGYITASPMLVEANGGAERRWLRVAGVRTVRRSAEKLCWSEVFVSDRLPVDREEIRALDGPIYQHCIELHGLKLNHVEQEIRATSLPARIADLLDAQPESAALLVVRRYVDSEGRTFEVSMNLYPADRYTVRSIIRPRP